MMQNYDSYQDIYRPAVRRSKLLSRESDSFRVYLQLFQKKIISVVVNTEAEVVYTPISATRMQVRSVSTRISQVEGAGTPSEREDPPGRDDGFLWRFNNYCSVEERERGTLVQCETVSLSRDIPAGLGWLIGGFVASVPRDSLDFTLTALRSGLARSADSSK